jgi:hypothetical protein
MRYKLIGDNDGHDYIIPTEQEDLFYRWVDAMESDEELDSDIQCFDDCRVNCSGWTFTDPQGWK